MLSTNVQPVFGISIHALHEESDSNTMRGASVCSIFQSTLSMRRATKVSEALGVSLDISIHALHEESDVLTDIDQQLLREFQSTLSMRRATVSA